LTAANVSFILFEKMQFEPTLLTDYMGQNPVGWLMSEKYDGIRAIWNGAAFLTREGNAIAVPSEIVAQMPATPLDGELWMGRGTLQRMAGLARKKVSFLAEWTEVRFMIFDAPGQASHAARMVALPALPDFCRIVTQRVCESKADLLAFAAEIVAKGGEGAVIRCPSAPYAEGRATVAQKLKPARTDEGILRAVERVGGAVRSLTVEWAGKVLKIGSGFTAVDAAREFVEGVKITFGFYGLTESGIPRGAFFVEVRNYE
jgi:DNA ligase 1